MFKSFTNSACLCLGVCFAHILLTPNLVRAGDFEESVRPYLEDTTVVLAHIDLTKVDKEPLFDWLRNNVGETPLKDSGTAIAFAMAEIQALTHAGAAHVYASVSTLDIAQGGAVFYLPCKDSATVRFMFEPFVDQLPARLGYKVFAAEGLVAVAPARTWNRIVSKPNAARAAIVESGISGSSHAASMLINLPERLRREAAQMLPASAPAAWPIQLSPQALISDTNALLLTIDLPPSPGVMLQITSESEAASQRTQATWEQLKAKLPKPISEIELTRDSPSALTLAALEPTLNATATKLAGQVLNAVNESRSLNSLKQIMLAMHNYYSAHNFLPPRETRSKDDRPLLSWRVHILPFIGEQTLYERFHLNEPWDSPHNAELIPQMPALYAADSNEAGRGKTRFVLPMLEGGAWKGDGPPLKFEQITDGTSNTIAVVVTTPDKSVTWTKPEELQLTPDTLSEVLFGNSNSFQAAMFDGAVRSVGRANSAEKIQAFITMQGGEPGVLE